MPKHIITLDKKKHQRFLAEKRKDPITKQPLHAGMQIVICANDKCAFNAENWLDSCPLCHMTETMDHIVSSEPIILTKTQVPDYTVNELVSDKKNNSLLLILVCLAIFFCFICCISFICYYSVNISNISDFSILFNVNEYTYYIKNSYQELIYGY